nr:hypothetical protein [uncultured Rhodopila sp.]
MSVKPAWHVEARSPRLETGNCLPPIQAAPEGMNHFRIDLTEKTARAGSIANAGRSSFLISAA